MSTFSTLRHLGCAAGLLLSLATAQAQAQDHASHHAPATAAASPAPAAAPDLALTEGVITRVDARSGKLTIRHGAITHLDMPPMTMVFGLQDAQQAAQFKPGDPVRFRVEDQAGALVITHIQPAS
ncbi:copper-binding protein [Comamonas aquatica]|uniref:Copper-binding protein n=1 Tax=Comamonas aquatica TaxID=225991 RepID=A0AA42HWA9_9BURK|nr:copper-binding protein [Comamonas aquatica]MDH0362872.1 copper-binding protein [Comamonas aquatica]